MNTTQIQALDRSHTVLIIANGIMEEHGPFLPSFTDGYLDEALAQDLARSIVARPGWAAALFPTIPLGVEPANTIGKRYVFPGSFTIRQQTMQAVFMDLADTIGQQGFQYIFLVDSHGGPANSRALDQACAYFHDTYGGRMVHLLGLMPVLDSIKALEQTLTPAELTENGLSVHADALEQSVTAFVRADLVLSAKLATSLSGADFPGLMTVASKPDWPGYLGAPRLATPATGALAYAQELDAMRKIALDTLDGKIDPSTLPHYGDVMGELSKAVDVSSEANERSLEKQHLLWIASHPRASAQHP